MIKPDIPNRRILISGEIEEEFGLLFTESMIQLQEKPLGIDIIFVSALGGCWITGKACLSMMINSPNLINTWAVGTIYSSSSMMFMAGDNRYCDPLGAAMFHYGTMELSDNLKEFERLAADIKKDIEFDCNFLSKRSNKPPGYFSKQLEADWTADANKLLELEMITDIALPG